ncbi:hypothetical protein O5169_27365 [Escherichia coli]|nr:hypothetical protein [Escherichia coli]MCZ6220921.1 hypothetical protein [Escherichia coli]
MATSLTVSSPAAPPAMVPVWSSAATAPDQHYRVFTGCHPAACPVDAGRSGRTLTNTTVYSQDAIQQHAQSTQAALAWLRAEGSQVTETSGYRPETRTLTISVCDEENNCSRNTVLSSAEADVQPPYSHTDVAAKPMTPGSEKNVNP